MAKHKKKKSPPTPDPDNTENQDKIEEKQDIPPTENVESSKEDPRSEEEKNETKRKLDRLFWLRIGLAVLAGIAATFLFDSIEGEERRWASIGFMILIFIVSIGIAKGMNLKLPKSDRKKIVTQAIGSYIFLYLFMWIVSYTLVNVNNDSITSIPFP